LGMPVMAAQPHRARPAVKTSTAPSRVFFSCEDTSA
jgi:hypothetical protein